MKPLNTLGLHRGEAQAGLLPEVHESNVNCAMPSDRAWGRRQALAALGASAVVISLAGCSNTKAKRVFDSLADSTHGVVVGDPSSAKTIYAFFDTECQHCRLLWTKSAPVFNQACWVWVPLDFVNADSRKRGIECLSSTDPKAWLEAHMAGQEPDPGKGNATLRAQADDFMTQNRQALNTLPERPGGVPFLVGWHDGDLVLLKSGGMMDLRMLGLGR